jgi:hypothetical protein
MHRGRIRLGALALVASNVNGTGRSAAAIGRLKRVT